MDKDMMKADHWLRKHIVTSIVVIGGVLVGYFFPEHNVTASVISSLYWIWKG